MSSFLMADQYTRYFNCLLLLIFGTYLIQTQSLNYSQSVITTRIIRSLRTTITVDDIPEPYASKSVNKRPRVTSIPPRPILKVPPGFRVNVFAEGLVGPRWLALTPSGDVLVTQTPENEITLLRDTDGDGVADFKSTFATKPANGLHIPFGMDFTWNKRGKWDDYFFFVGNTDHVRRFNYKYGSDNVTERGTRIANLPGYGYNQHWTRNVIVSPFKTTLYVSVGSQGNVAEEPLPRAAVIQMGLDGSRPRVFAYGLRNPVGLDFHPATYDLYTTVNERDGLGDDLVPDYFTRIQQNQFFGWPYAYLKPDLLDPRMLNGSGGSLREDLANRTRTPDVLFQSHSAALGLKFYRGNKFPTKYRKGAFVAFRGSWNRNSGTGYKLVFVPFDSHGRPEGYYEDFLTGFLSNPSGPTVWGRPVGLLEAKDGSLLFTEEPNGRIYRIEYRH